MREATLLRASDSGTQCLGLFVFLKTDGQIWVAKSLERPWLMNEPEVSCIPAGEYECVYTRSNRLSKATGRDYYTYEVLDVPDRSGIRIHSGNYAYKKDGKPDIFGCILLGDAHKDINLDGTLDIIHSGATVKAFEAEMNYEPFLLTITEP